MKLRFSLSALLFLRSEQAYIARFNKRAAKATVAQIGNAAKMLAEYPAAGAVLTPVPGVRRYVSAPYQIDYVIAGDAVVIVAIRHGRQNPSMEIDDDADFEEPSRK
jgi:plasmid stabilization system protein ParE